MKRRRLISGLFISLLLTSCEEASDTAAAEVADSGKNQEIFTKNKEFLYIVSRLRKDGQPLPIDTVVLTSHGITWKIDSIQKSISWGYTDRRDWGGSTGVIEDAGHVWIHPPRFSEYAILELSPFPEVKKPFVAGQEWDWELEVGDHYANPAWAVWKGNMLVKSHYKATGTRLVATAFGQLKCQEVTAVARCAQGNSTLRTLFHPAYGFVLLDYGTIDGGRLTLKLRHAGVSNAFDGGAFYKQK